MGFLPQRVRTTALDYAGQFFIESDKRPLESLKKVDFSENPRWQKNVHTISVLLKTHDHELDVSLKSCLH